jgi:hypothetical protein
MMERSENLATMNELKLYGMRNAYDESITRQSSVSTHLSTSPQTCSPPRSPKSRHARSNTS